MDLLRIENVTAGYGREAIIQGISLSIPRGSILGVIGPNGAGKTTLFRTISKVMKPMSGKIAYDGTDISGLSHRAFARNVSVIPQFRTVPPPFTVEEFVSMGRYPHGRRLSPLNSNDRLIVEESLKLLNLTRFRDKRMNALSGGEMQRVFLAQGLAQKPDLILMDEPTTHLDITHKIRILDVIASLSKSSGLTALIILHDLNLTSAYCDRVAMMKEGVIHAAGRPEEVLTEENITAVYDTPVRVGKDTVTSRPHIFFLPKGLHRGMDKI